MLLCATGGKCDRRCHNFKRFVVIEIFYIFKNKNWTITLLAGIHVNIDGGDRSYGHKKKVKSVPL